MASSLSNLVDNFAKQIHNTKSNTDMIMKSVKLNGKIVSVILNTQTLTMI